MFQRIKHVVSLRIDEREVLVALGNVSQLTLLGVEPDQLLRVWVIDSQGALRELRWHSRRIILRATAVWDPDLRQ